MHFEPQHSVGNEPKQSNMRFQNQKYQAFFINGGYAVMRHARVVSETTGDIADDSADMCRQVTRDLVEAIGNRPIVIHHSPLARAVNTARLVHDELQTLGVPVNKVLAEEWLRSDSFRLMNENITAVCEMTPGCFTLFITHYPDIKSFLNGNKRGVDIPEAYNCTIFARDFLIPGKRD